MTEPTPVLLSYATPSDQPRPTFAKVLPIIGISVGCLQLLADLVEFCDLHGMLVSYYHIDFLVFGVLAIGLIAASIGCLKPRPAARVWIVRYAVAYLVACVLELVTAPLIVLAPGVLRFGEVVDPATVRYLVHDAKLALVTDAFTTVLPIVILFYMTRPKMIARFSTDALSVLS